VPAARRPPLAVLILFVSTLAVLVSAPAASGAAKGFTYGVAAGDVNTVSAILWARAARTGTAVVQVVPRGSFGPCQVGTGLGSVGAGIGIGARVSADGDKTVQKRVGGLEPGSTYRYRFCMSGGAHSSTGSFETAPAPNQAKTIHFALSGDQDAVHAPGQSKPFWNNFQIWRLIRKEQNDFNVMLGDTIYSDSEVPGAGGKSKTAITVPAKWKKYRTNLGQDFWAQARGAASYYAHWDDHEFINDFSKFENVFPESGGDVHVNGKALYKRGVKAFRDYNPITYSARNGIYRSFRWGKNLEIFFLDERSFRSQSADYNGTCDNPPGSGNPDLAPTAPQSTRNVFAILIPSLGNPPPPACLQKINDPSRTMLGKAQLAKFEAAIKRSRATFKVIFNEVPIQQYYALPYDRWEGYEPERIKLLEFLRHNVENALFLTTDVHANMVNDARLKTLESGGPVNSGITDITTGPIATKTYAGEIDDVSGPGTAPLIQSAFFKPQPPNGVGMQCAGLDQFSYAEVTVGRKTLKVELKDIQGNTVKDTGDRDAAGPPCGPYVFQAQNHPPAG
jgi:phosphodiesterase/alkaline phosphatase D-like protein